MSPTDPRHDDAGTSPRPDLRGAHVPSHGLHHVPDLRGRTRRVARPKATTAASPHRPRLRHRSVGEHEHHRGAHTPTRLGQAGRHRTRCPVRRTSQQRRHAPSDRRQPVRRNDDGARRRLGTSNASTINAAIDAIIGDGGPPFDIGMTKGADDMLDSDRTTHNGVTVKQVVIFLSDSNPDPDGYAPISAGSPTTSRPPTRRRRRHRSRRRRPRRRRHRVSISPSCASVGPATSTPATGVGSACSDARQGARNRSTSCTRRSRPGRPAQGPQGPRARPVTRASFDLWIGGTAPRRRGRPQRLAGEHGLEPARTGPPRRLTGSSLADYTASVSCGDTGRRGRGPVAARRVRTPAGHRRRDQHSTSSAPSNTRGTGTLTVTRIVTTAMAARRRATPSGSRSMAVDDGFEADYANVSPCTGGYSVIEPAVNGYDTTYANCTNVAVTAGQRDLHGHEQRPNRHPDREEGAQRDDGSGAEVTDSAPRQRWQPDLVRGRCRTACR